MDAQLLPYKPLSDEAFRAKWGPNFDLMEAVKMAEAIIIQYPIHGLPVSAYFSEPIQTIGRSIRSVLEGSQHVPRQYSGTLSPEQFLRIGALRAKFAELWYAPEKETLPTDTPDWHICYRKQVVVDHVFRRISVVYRPEVCRGCGVPLDAMDAMNAILDFVRTDTFVRRCGAASAFEWAILHVCKFLIFNGAPFAPNILRKSEVTFIDWTKWNGLTVGQSSKTAAEKKMVFP